MELIILLWVLGYLVSSFIMIDYIVVEAAQYDATDHDRRNHNLVLWYMVIISINLVLWPLVLKNYWQNKSYYTEEMGMRQRLDDNKKPGLHSPVSFFLD
jgi:hypothetical protein